MAAAPKTPRKPRELSQSEKDRKLREHIALEYAIRDAANTDEHVKFLDAIFKWVRAGTIPGTKPDFEVHEGGKGK